jgi:hypothetical protein
MQPRIVQPPRVVTHNLPIKPLVVLMTLQSVGLLRTTVMPTRSEMMPNMGPLAMMTQPAA